ncbi:uncharacterized protein [Ambystoma mexicanum]|uniref:uncharacterized protein n=1 Tax=Ambystoma mexicanum TaxID=8296 RepID=UPI0037E8D53A
MTEADKCLVSNEQKSSTFTVQELSVLVQEVRGHYENLFGTTSKKLSMLAKKQIWESILRSVNRAGQGGRTIADVKRRWKDIERHGDRWPPLATAGGPCEEQSHNATEENPRSPPFTEGPERVDMTDIGMVSHPIGAACRAITGHSPASILDTILESQEEYVCSQETTVFQMVSSINPKSSPCGTRLSPEASTKDHSPKSARSQTTWEAEMLTLQTKHTDMLQDVRKDMGLMYSDLRSFSMQVSIGLSTIEKQLVVQQQTLRQLETQNRVLWSKQLEIGSRTESMDDLLVRLTEFLADQRDDRAAAEPRRHLMGMVEEQGHDECRPTYLSPQVDRLKRKPGGKRKTKSADSNTNKKKK